MIISRQTTTERHILSTLPVLYLPLYKRDGSIFISDDGAGYLCTVTGALWTQQGRTFDIIDDLIIIPTSTPIETITPTVTVWARFPTTADDSYLITKGTLFAGKFWQIGTASGSVKAWIRGTSDATRAIFHTTPANEWHCYTATFSGANVGTHLDGRLVAVTTGTQALTEVLGNITIGAFDDTGGASSGATIGEVHLYNRILTPLEIQRNYLATKWRYQ